MRRLHLNRIPADFSPERDAVLAIGSFCGCESLYPGWEELDYVEIFKDREEQVKGYAMLRGLACDFYLPQVVGELNRRHATNLSTEFWGILLKPWLLMFFNLSWFLYLQLVKFIEQNPSEAFEVDILIKEDPWDFEDTMDFFARGYRDIRFHHWLLSLFLQERKPQNWLLVPKRSNGSDRPIPLANKSHPCFEYVKSRLSSYFYSKRCVDVYGMSRIQLMLFSLYLELKPVREKEEMPPAELPPPEKKDYAGYFPLPYRKVVGAQIEKVLPGIFSEGFEANYSRTKKNRYVKNRIRMIGPVHWYSDGAKFLLAAAKEQGEKIVCTQHGGTYGIAKIPNLIPDIEYSHDNFFSWGWQQHDPFQVNASALPSPMLSKLRQRRYLSRRTDKLVFVGTSLSPFELRFDILPKGKRLLHYRKEKVEFLGRLSPAVSERTHYRPIPSNIHTLLREKEYLREKFPDLKFIEGMPAPHPEILKCRLLVLDNPQTTIHVSLAANIPTICFWNTSDWAIADSALPYFEALEKAGIILPDGAAAALKVNEIWGHVGDWWNSRDIQEARTAWCREYARTGRFWWWPWIRTLWDI